jgi:hypothetical protein
VNSGIHRFTLLIVIYISQDISILYHHNVMCSPVKVIYNLLPRWDLQILFKMSIDL